MRTILLPLAGLAAVTVTACTTVVPPPPQVMAAAPVAAEPSQYCREYSSTATVDGKPQETVGTACLGADGNWRIVDTQNPPGDTANPVPTAPPQTYAAAPPVAYPPAYPYYGYPYYPAPYYYPPYPYYYGPAVGVGFGFRFGGGGSGHHHH